MKISLILASIDNGTIALPEFQRGYVWNREQVRGLFDSLYRRHPVGGLLVWSTQSKSAAARGDSRLDSRCLLVQWRKRLGIFARANAEQSKSHAQQWEKVSNRGRHSLEYF